MSCGWENVSATLKIIVIYSDTIRRCCYYSFFLSYHTKILHNHCNKPIDRDEHFLWCGKNNCQWAAVTQVNKRTATIGKTEALNVEQGGHQFRTHQVHIPLKWSFINNKKQLQLEGNILICWMNSFLPGHQSGVMHITRVLKNILLWIMQFSHRRFKLDSGFKSDIQHFMLWCCRDERATSTGGWCYCFNWSIWTCSQIYQVWQTLTLKAGQGRALKPEIDIPAHAQNAHITMCLLQWLSLTVLFTNKAAASLGKDG